MLGKILKDKLATRLVVYSLLVSTFLSALAAGFQLYTSYQRQRADIVGVISSIEGAFTPSLERALWTFDTAQSSILLDSLIAHEAVAAVRLIPTEGSVLSRGAADAGPVDHSVTLMHRPPNAEPQLVGRLDVTLTLNALKERIWAQFRALLVSNLIKAYLSALCLLALFHFLITRHLNRISDHLEAPSWPNNAPPLQLARARINTPDVLDTITSAVNHAHERISETNAALKSEIDTRRRAEVEAKNAAEVRETFIATMSHEIRTPLNAIMGFFQLLKIKGTTDKQVQLSEAGLQASQRLLDQLVNVLEISRLNGQAVHVELKSTPLKPLAQTWQDVLTARLHLANKPVEGKFTFGEGLPDAINTDPGRLTQVVTNFIDNAVKFTDVGSVSVSVALSSDGKAIEIAVEDTGKGIPSDKQSRIFERFAQLETGPSRSGEGSGLGLAICSELCGLLKYSISVHSPVPQTGFGSRMQLAIPLTPEQGDFDVVQEENPAG